MFDQLNDLSIYKEEVDNFYIKSIVNTLFKNGDVKLDNVFFINYIIFL